MAHIRHSYEDLGVDEYYRHHGDQYHNPHVKQVRELVIRGEKILKYDRTLDLCCGAGEVSGALIDLGYLNVVGSDPFTYRAYERELSRPCLKYSFDDLIRGALANQQYSCIISSFAMHLCPKDKLYGLTYALFRCTEKVAIITPHKRPQLEHLSGVHLMAKDVAFTSRGKRITLKVYEMPDHPERKI